MERGKLAEFIVALALGVEKQINPSWAPYDLLSQEGIKIEVKTSAYIQAWGQTKLSSLSFGIQPTHEYNDVNSTFAEASVRQSDVYVFCVQNHKEQETLNTLDLKQWEFYILRTNKLNEACGGQKHIGIKKLLKLGAIKADYENMYRLINEVMKTS